ncbi:hypothetical protein NHH03_08630 [Stieleria sp. TO1_6]|uniref:hypothetical protein n=1 Tax=Stieleria tagensis TaxID=2956795 RepID=UPI00209ABA97|nr:hypothetical protein [Stieleria tagensis]MCO8121800.1 hypothetical protein [Stieleria tagensis]
MRKFIVLSVAFVSILAAAALTRGISPDAGTSGRSADSRPSGADGGGKLIVHEWGTFTTFSGSDGLFMDFRPLATEHSDLPAYVLDRGSYSNLPLFTKNRVWGRVRMETPVTYFYTDRIRSVDVRVDFPEGLLTEFYPPVKSMQPSIDEQNLYGKGELIGNSSLNWGRVDLIPIDQLMPHVSDKNLRGELLDGLVRGLLPTGPNEQHYAHARETDSALVHVRNPVGRSRPEAGYFEKFLFYRGVGKFTLPVSAHYDSSAVIFKNAGELPIQTAILIEVDGQEIRATKLDRLAPMQSKAFNPLEPMTESGLAELLQQSLVAEGLYEKEAASMVKTWQESWFTENGTRVLYLVPPALTDRLLPLHVTPHPQESLRVLVGRMEIMSPDAEHAMLSAVAESAVNRELHTATLKSKTTTDPYPVPDAIRGFGRMTEPALVRVAKITTTAAVRHEAETLLKQLRQ